MNSGDLYDTMDKELIKKVLQFICDKGYGGHTWGGGSGMPQSSWLSQGDSDWSHSIEEVVEEFEKEQFFIQARQQ